ncbi:hypothetical protein PILCRDRAFT_822630 [Piloderma croceum F 1598]|uniref:Iminophenyl-pyruvate dimer synthase domain-containing protein n=1 Tax=Piloderma croceum (strain F 1598) TaxID=765440 RepID=A0A0C3F695_PILCF|nr:hypothetical protein PILCRDRAFT_822630 [Piloderma croceum F 1598]
MDLYDYDVIPRYPGHILVQKIDMNLDRANKENLECFLQIEAPDTPRPPPDNDEPGLLPDPSKLSAEAMFRATATNDLAPGYKSIGDFYDDLKKGLKQLPDSAFAHNKDEQFSGLDFFDDQMVVITDQASALNALDTIIEQGEGNVAVPDSHYAVFVKLYLNREGWAQLKVPTNPQTKDYKGHSDKDLVYKLSLVFDAGFCYLLQTIQRIWKTDRTANKIVLRLLLLRNVHAIMTNVLTPVANILVRQRLDNDKNRVAAPCFNYYPLKDDGKPENPLSPRELYTRLCQLVANAILASPTDDMKESLSQMRDYIRDKIRPEP